MSKIKQVTKLNAIQDDDSSEEDLCQPKDLFKDRWEVVMD